MNNVAEIAKKIQSLIAQSKAQGKAAYPCMLAFADPKKEPLFLFTEADVLPVVQRYTTDLRRQTDLIDWVSYQKKSLEDLNTLPGILPLETFPMYFFWAKLDDKNVRLRESITKANFFDYHSLPNLGDYGWKKGQLIDFIFDVILPETDFAPDDLMSILSINYFREFMKNKNRKLNLVMIVDSYLRDGNGIKLAEFVQDLKATHLSLVSRMVKFRDLVESIVASDHKFRYNWQYISNVLSEKFARGELIEVAKIEDIPHPGSLSQRDLSVALAKKMQALFLDRDALCANKITAVGMDNVNSIQPHYLFTFVEKNNAKEYLYCEDIRELYDHVIYENKPTNPFTNKKMQEDVIAEVVDTFRIVHKTKQ
jgi:hypothetical protein